MWPFNNKQEANKVPLTQNEFIKIISQFNNNIAQLNQEYTSEEYVKNGYSGNADAYAIINYIITTASNVPLMLEIKQADGTWLKDEKSKFIELINNPNPEMGYSLMIEELLGWKMIDGAGYLYAPRLDAGLNKGKSNELWVMPSVGMQVIGGGPTQLIKEYTYDRWDKAIPSDKVMMIRYFNPSGALTGDKRAIFTGQSPLKAAELVLKKLNTGAVAEISAYSNGGANGFISREGIDGDFTPEQLKGLEERFKASSGGAKNFRKLVATPANVKYHKTGDSPADMDIVNASLAAKRQLAAIFKFPTELLNDPDGSTFNNQAEAHKALYTNVIIPEMRDIGEGLVRWMGRDYHPNETIRITPDTSNIEVLQKNRKEQAEWLAKAYWIKANRKQEIMGEATDDEMDDYFLPSNLLASSEPNIDEDELRRRTQADKDNE